MPMFKVVLCVSYTVEAEDKSEALEKALESLQKDLEDLGFLGLKDIFSAEVFLTYGGWECA